jgi:hypothetical protein
MSQLELEEVQEINIRDEIPAYQVVLSWLLNRRMSWAGHATYYPQGK